MSRPSEAVSLDEACYRLQVAAGVIYIEARYHHEWASWSTLLTQVVARVEDGKIVWY